MITQALNSIRNGDMKAFGELYDMSYEKVYRFIYHRTSDHERSEDIVADTYMKAMKRIGGFRGVHEGEFFSWIYRIAYTTMIDGARRNHIDTSLEDAGELGYTVDQGRTLDNQLQLERVMEYLNTLTHREREFITMRIWDELSYEEIHQITGESVANAKKIVSRTLAKISANVACLILLGTVFPTALLNFYSG